MNHSSTDVAVDCANRKEFRRAQSMGFDYFWLDLGVARTLQSSPVGRYRSLVERIVHGLALHEAITVRNLVGNL